MSYNNLTYDERECIEYLLEMEFTQADIAKMLNRSESTISREIHRNVHHWHGYQAAFAQNKYENRVYSKRTKPVLEDPMVYEHVRKKLKLGWAPHIIAGRSKQEMSSIMISTESIFRLVYHDFKRGGDLWKLLPSKRKRRKNQLGRPDQRGQIEGRRFIDERPAVVEKRNRFGHWEGDTIIGGHHKGAIFTSIERKSRYMLAWNSIKKEAERMVHSVQQAFTTIPGKLRKTLTVDNGLEFTNHGDISKKTGLDVYFSHPGCPYEKGSVENGNKILRKYFPKGTDLREVSHWKLKEVINNINHTPRKILNYLTPYEVLFNHGKIALQI